jgi:hypothetical protein
VDDFEAIKMLEICGVNISDLFLAITDYELKDRSYMYNTILLRVVVLYPGKCSVSLEEILLSVTSNILIIFFACKISLWFLMNRLRKSFCMI